jgi:hypothetical protein
MKRNRTVRAWRLFREFPFQFIGMFILLPVVNVTFSVIIFTSTPYGIPSDTAFGYVVPALLTVVFMANVCMLVRKTGIINSAMCTKQVYTDVMPVAAQIPCSVCILLTAVTYGICRLTGAHSSWLYPLLLWMSIVDFVCSLCIILSMKVSWNILNLIIVFTAVVPFLPSFMLKKAPVTMPRWIFNRFVSLLICIGIIICSTVICRLLAAVLYTKR